MGIIIPIWKVKKLRHREVKATHQRHTLKAVRTPNQISVLLSSEMQKRRVSWETHSRKELAHVGRCYPAPYAFLFLTWFPHIPFPEQLCKPLKFQKVVRDSSSPSHAEPFNTHFTLDAMKMSFLQEALFCSPDLRRQQDDVQRGKKN